ncbi:STAS domain-containing protein [Methylobacterium sp. J-077]|uniref:STAS domain-containing protein n=1 Tax=Methylobacterium sp. J-077 TaxID=2836656 RepID=UPI001FBA4A55|nr:STAS domain-containing protein [Methylobacterium sp. J-077]MCJ2127071.1 STAS domain-containing protein [Methylobacterium sp. J-077]
MAEPVTLTMPPDCTLRTAQALRADLLAALDGASGLALDCAAIETVDVTFVQLVVAAAKSAASRGTNLDLINRPDAVTAAFRRAGIAPQPPFEAASVPTL